MRLAEIPKACYRISMSDRLFFISLALGALSLIALSLVWPQGLGDRSPAPFGHPPAQRTPEMQAAMKREQDHAAQQMQAAQSAPPAGQATGLAK
jgi:hypothetical protein